MKTTEIEIQLDKPTAQITKAIIDAVKRVGATPIVRNGTLYGVAEGGLTVDVRNTTKHAQHITFTFQPPLNQDEEL